ncbi:MAG: thymidine kinase [Candidatus Pacearchaeota archaeon]
MEFFHPFMPGFLEVYCGPMKSGKTRELLHRVDKLDYLPNRATFFKPSTDTRDTKIHSRYLNGDKSIPCIIVGSKDSYSIVSQVEGIDVVVIDEAQFFDSGLIRTVEELVRARKNVIIGGLDLDFRGEPFGPMPQILARANVVTKLTAVCEYIDGNRCDRLASRSQRLIDGVPERYEANTVAVEDTSPNSRETYEARCLEHHFVPR